MKKNIIIALLSIAVIVLGVFYIQKPKTIEKPVIIEKGVPVEVIKEVEKPVEVIKEKEVIKEVEKPVEVAQKNLYPECGIITEVDYNTDTVTFTCYNGNSFSFSGCEDFTEGDMVAAIMNDNGTNYVNNDTVVSVRYGGQF